MANSQSKQSHQSNDPCSQILTHILLNSCGACVRLGLVCQQADVFCQVDIVKPKESPKALTPSPPRIESNIQQDIAPLEWDEWSQDVWIENDFPVRREAISHSTSQFPDYTLVEHTSWFSNIPQVSEPQLYPGDEFLPNDDEASPTLSEDSPVPSTLHLLHMFPQLAGSDYQLLQYYTEKLSSCMANADGIWNPLRILIIPRMVSSTLLFHAVSACAAQHQALYVGARKVEYEHLATSHYVRALLALTKHIPSVYESRGAEETPDKWINECVLLNSIFLCKYEIIKNGVAIWRSHLDGIEPLSEHLRLKYPNSMKDTLRFARSLYLPLSSTLK